MSFVLFENKKSIKVSFAQGNWTHCEECYKAVWLKNDECSRAFSWWWILIENWIIVYSKTMPRFPIDKLSCLKILVPEPVFNITIISPRFLYHESHFPYGLIDGFERTITALTVLSQINVICSVEFFVVFSSSINKSCSVAPPSQNWIIFSLLKIAYTSLAKFDSAWAPFVKSSLLKRY